MFKTHNPRRHTNHRKADHQPQHLQSVDAAIRFRADN